MDFNQDMRLQVRLEIERRVNSTRHSPFEIRFSFVSYGSQLRFLQSGGSVMPSIPTDFTFKFPMTLYPVKPPSYCIDVFYCFPLLKNGLPPLIGFHRAIELQIRQSLSTPKEIRCPNQAINVNSRQRR